MSAQKSLPWTLHFANGENEAQKLEHDKKVTQQETQSQRPDVLGQFLLSEGDSEL